MITSEGRFRRKAGALPNKGGATAGDFDSATGNRGIGIAHIDHCAKPKKAWLLVVSVFVLLLFGPLVAQAQAVYYVRTGATGSNNGSDWANVFTSLPSTLQRGATYYVADGDYPAYVFDDPVSNTTLITIKKAVLSDHGTDTGWQESYGDGQAVFAGMSFKTGYLIIDGVSGGGPNAWESGHGIKVTGLIGTPNSADGYNHSNITLKHIEVDRGATSANSTTAAAFYRFTDLTVQYCYWHNIGSDIMTVDRLDNFTLEFSKWKFNYEDAAYHGDPIQNYGNDSNNWVIRYNYFEDLEGTYCFGSHGGTQLSGLEVYGNIFRFNSCSFGGFGNGFIGTISDGTVTNVKFYNNVISGYLWSDFGFIGNITNSIAYNNIWHREATCGAYSVGWSGTTHFNNTFYNMTTQSGEQNLSGDPFVDSVKGDFRLAAPTSAGSILASPYAVDMLGNTRAADGIWDRGAFEFNSGDTPTPHAPSGLRTVPQ